MQLEINFFLIIFISLIILLTVYFPISGHFAIKKLKKGPADGGYNKSKLYRETIIWLWIPVFLILLLIPISGTDLNSIGIKWIDLDANSLNKWVVYPSIGLYILYLLYNIYLILVLKYNKESRVKASQGISDDYRLFFPITKNEKHLWSYVSFSAGIAEEIIYRGYFFYALAVLFQGLSLIQILFITTLLFGIGHIYQGTKVIKPTIIGLIYGIFYLVFDSVLPVIIIHVTQDLVIRDILDDEDETTNTTSTGNEQSA